MNKFQWLGVRKYQILIILILAAGVNINTLSNDYALDDCVVLTQNRFVQQGIKGIPDLLSHDSFYGYTTDKDILSGARYRPLSLISFALEYELFGINSFISHWINLFLLIVLILLLHKFLSESVFKDRSSMLSFMAVLLFVVHPVHTEVVANVKSRDEILTFIFLILSLIVFFKTTIRPDSKKLFLSLLFYFFALLTKENAITFIVIIPLVLYFFQSIEIKNALKKSFPFLLVLLIYLIIRYIIVGLGTVRVYDITNSPYIYATWNQALATKIYILFRYMMLLVFPYPLTSDYGYNQIPYLELYSPLFILSIIVCISLLVYALRSFSRRSIYSFCILYFFASISVASNFIFDLGTPMAERLLFQPSLAYSIAMSFLLFGLYKNGKTVLTLMLLSALVISFSAYSVERNKVWKNNQSLFLTDVITSRNSARMNLYASEQCLILANKDKDDKRKKLFLQWAVHYAQRSLEIIPEFAPTLWRLGLAHYHLSEYREAAACWVHAMKLDPDNKEMIAWRQNLSMYFLQQGINFSEQKNLNEAVASLNTSLALNPEYKEARFQLHHLYLLQGDTLKANALLQKSAQQNH